MSMASCTCTYTMYTFVHIRIKNRYTTDVFIAAITVGNHAALLAIAAYKPNYDM